MGGGGGGGGGVPMGVGTLGGTLMNFADPLDLSGSKAAAGLQAQQGAADQANQTQANVFNMDQQNAQPYMQAGANGLNQLQAAMPDLTKSFSMSDFQSDPGYQFQMQQGMKALQQSAAASGSLGSGGTMKALTQYSQGLASQDYQNAFNRFTQSQQQKYGMLSGLAGIGQTAVGQVAGAGQNYANQVSQTQMGMGNAAAAANTASANRMSGLAGQGAGIAAMAMCDERLKTNIEPVSQKDLANLKSHLKAYKFNYKSNKHGSGDYIGLMAQDLEKSKLGRTLIIEDKDGFKQIDMNRVMMLFLASMAEG